MLLSPLSVAVVPALLPRMVTVRLPSGVSTSLSLALTATSMTMPGLVEAVSSLATGASLIAVTTSDALAEEAE